MAQCDLFELHLGTSELWFGREQEGILPELLICSLVVVLCSFYSFTVIWAAHRFGLPDLALSHWVHSLCLGYFVCVRLFSCIISACMLYYCNTVRWSTDRMLVSHSSVSCRSNQLLYLTAAVLLCSWCRCRVERASWLFHLQNRARSSSRKSPSLSVNLFSTRRVVANFLEY